jgi:hypothetical protein
MKCTHQAAAYNLTCSSSTAFLRFPGPWNSSAIVVKVPYSLEGAHAEDLRFGALLDTPDAVLVHRQLEDFPGPALEAAQEVLVAVEKSFGPLVATDQGSV